MNKEVTQIQNTILSLYLENFRFIKNINVNLDIIFGEFQIPERSYTVDDTRGLSAACQLILFNQATIIASAANLILGNWKDKTDYKLQLNECYVKEYAKNIVIQKFSELTYRKPITTHSAMKFELEFTKFTDKYHSHGFIFFDVELRLNRNEQFGSGAYCLWRDKSTYIQESD